MAAVWLGGTTSFHAQEPDDRYINYYRIVTPKSPEDLFKGYSFYEAILPVDLAQKDTLNALHDLRMLAIGQFNLGDYHQAENHVVEGLALMDRSAHSDTMADSKKGLYNQLGRIYAMLFNDAKAEEALEQALRFSKSRKDSVVIINNIGTIYMDREAYAEAKIHFSKAFALAKTLEDPFNYAKVLDNLGRVQSGLGDPDALSLLSEALQIRKELDLHEELYASYKSLAMHHRNVKDAPNALSYADSTLQMAETLNSPAFVVDALSLQIDLGNYQGVVRHKQLDDSLAKAKQLADNTFAALKYDVNQERLRTQTQKLQKEREKKLRIGYQGTALILLILGGSFFYYFRTRQKQKAQKQVYLSETRISKKVHDEVANEVYGVMTRLQQETGVKKEVIDDLENLYNKTRDISKEYNLIDYQEGFGEVLNDLFLTYQSPEVNIITKNLTNIDWEKLNSLKKTVLYRVLQELLTNMKKHSGASIVAISLQQNGKKISLDYADNGVGTELKKRGGLLNTETRIQSVNGKIIFESSPKQGFKAKIAI